MFPMFPIFNSGISNIQNNTIQRNTNLLTPQGITTNKNELTCDVFQRSTNAVNATNEVDDISTKEGIQKIFDETYQTVLSQNPITQKLNIQKPVLKFDSKHDDSTALAGYTFFDNSIEVYPLSIKQDLYSVTAITKDGQKIPLDIKTNDIAQQTVAESKKDPDIVEVQTKKLSNEEKKLYLKCVFAHELRHSIQSHLIASTDGCQEEQKAMCEDLYNSLKKVENSQKKMMEMDKNYKMTATPVGPKESIYSLNYKPKMLLDKNTSLKFSKLPDDNRCFSVKDHFLKSQIASKEEADYLAKPVEIDAYNYEFEFLLSQKEQSMKKGVSEDFVNALFAGANLQCDEGIENLEKCGYPQFKQLN